MKKILLLGASAHRSGAPIHLFNTLNTNRYRSDSAVSTLLVNRGELTGDFKKCQRTHFAPDLFRRLASTNRVTNPLLRTIRSAIIKKYAWESIGFVPDVVVANGILAFPYMSILSGNRVKCVPYLMENLHSIRKYSTVTYAELDKYRDSTIYCSGYIRSNLSGPSRDNNIHHCSVYVPPMTENIAERDESVYTIGSIGTLGWRKGSDFFIQVAKHLSRCKVNNRALRFVWVGDHHSTLEGLEFDHDVRSFGLKDFVQHIESTEAVAQIVKSLDLALVLSRDEPFGMAGIESMVHGVPTLSWDSNVGMAEVYANKNEYTCEYGNVERMCNLIVHHLKNRVNLKDSFDYEYYSSAESQCDHFFQCIRSVV